MAVLAVQVPLPPSSKMAAVLTAKSDVPTGMSKAVAMRNPLPAFPPAQFTAGDMVVYEELVARGDGGYWVDRVMSPIFTVLAFGA